MLTFLHVIEETNKNPHLLPNITVEYHIYDSCAAPVKAIKSILHIFSGPGKVIPNYSCSQKNLVGFVGDHYSSSTIPMAQLVAGVYRYTQISYGATDNVLSDRNLFPTFLRTVKNDDTTFSIMAELVEYFGWTWVGIIASNDDNGEKDTRLLTSYLARHGTCVAFVVKADPHKAIQSIRVIEKSSAQIIIPCGTSTFLSSLFFRLSRDVLRNKTFILSSSWAGGGDLWTYYPDIFNLSLLIGLDLVHLPFMDKFMNSFHPLKYPNDKLLAVLWALNFHCSSGIKEDDNDIEVLYNIRLNKCNGTERLLDIGHYPVSGTMEYVYISTTIWGSVLNHMAQVQNLSFEIFKHKHKLYEYMKLASCRESGISDSFHCFDEKGEFQHSIRIRRSVVDHKLDLSINAIGIYKHHQVDGWTLQMYQNPHQWKNDLNTVPISQCSPSCLPGYRKVSGPGMFQCCYDCVPCSEGEISTVSDSVTCVRCLEDSWPNKDRTQCVPKPVEFLTYQDDVLSVVFIFTALFFCFVTLVVIGIFLKHWDTPIVKANNKTLSMVLLLSIMLVFLCVFLFLGHPVDITCRIRQITFALLFTVAVSSLLAKTTMVCIAFKATRPDSVWRKWIGVRLPNCVVFFGSCPQAIICTAWLMTSPPFQELDRHTYHTKIIVQCNEGSVIGFYSVLGYMGLLAAVSFITAFVARTLPDNFNEATYITFSMLVFCSVWIAMIVAYLSTKGKYLVAVEIFAILTSNIGLLGCIFFPKCFIILRKPKSHIIKSAMKSKYSP